MKDQKKERHIKDNIKELDISVLFNRLENLEIKVHNHDNRLEEMEKSFEDTKDDLTSIQRSMSILEANMSNIEKMSKSDNLRILGISIIIFSICILLFKLTGI